MLWLLWQALLLGAVAFLFIAWREAEGRVRFLRRALELDHQVVTAVCAGNEPAARAALDRRWEHLKAFAAGEAGEA